MEKAKNVSARDNFSVVKQSVIQCKKSLLLDPLIPYFISSIFILIVFLSSNL